LRKDYTWKPAQWDELPLLAASARSVCTIAADLMRFLLDCRLCEGAWLVGESVSSYFIKERAKIRDLRIQARKRFLEKQRKPISVFVFQKTSYDNIGTEENASDSDEPLSDDDEFDREESSRILESFRSGLLPSSLLFMYGLSLAGLGGRDYIAARY
jgi:hypothetical protein